MNTYRSSENSSDFPKRFFLLVKKVTHVLSTNSKKNKEAMLILPLDGGLFDHYENNRSVQKRDERFPN